MEDSLKITTWRIKVNKLSLFDVGDGVPDLSMAGSSSLTEEHLVGLNSEEAWGVVEYLISKRKSGKPFFSVQRRWKGKSFSINRAAESKTCYSCAPESLPKCVQDFLGRSASNYRRSCLVKKLPWRWQILVRINKHVPPPINYRESYIDEGPWWIWNCKRTRIR
jgi:hypothetical protein